MCWKYLIRTGYVFSDAQSIAPHLEEPKTGPSSRFCAELAQQLECYVVAGYPSKLEPGEAQERPAEDVIAAEDPELPTEYPVGANSAIMYGPTGEWIGGYRKTNLFSIDKTWAKPGIPSSTPQTRTQLTNYPLRHRFRNLPPSLTPPNRHTRDLHGPQCRSTV